MNNIASITALAAEVHGDNVSAGWWSDIRTGASILETRNRPEILMLVVSELAEASHGFLHNLPDDKLPHYPMFDVELADTAIRLLDIIGVENSLNTGFPPATGTPISIMTRSLRTKNYDEQLMFVVNSVANAMECHRKGRITEYREALTDSLIAVFAIADLRSIDLMAVINAKRGFNRNRLDHKIANRMKAGGKQY
jgi:hypothetical protein